MRARKSSIQCSSYETIVEFLYLLLMRMFFFSVFTKLMMLLI